jgi:acyl-CoA synthetase (NDP forming)
VNAVPAPHDRMRKIANAIAETVRTSGSTIVTYQVSPLGPVDGEFVTSLHAAGVPLLMGITSSIGALKHLPRRQAFAARAVALVEVMACARPAGWDFLRMRQALVDSGVPVVDATLASSEDAAIAAFRRFGRPVALKAEADGLLHKSDLGCVRLNCATEAEVTDGYRAVIANAHKAGFRDAGVLIQPMVPGVAEAYAGIIDDPLYGPAIVFGLGGIFVEILKDTTIEMAPLSRGDALAMIHRLKAAPLLLGARGGPRGDVDALAAFLVRLGHFAVANSGTFRALDLNPIMVKAEGEGVVAVDIAVDTGDIPPTGGHR